MGISRHWEAKRLPPSDMGMWARGPVTETLTGRWFTSALGARELCCKVRHADSPDPFLLVVN